MLIQLLSPDCSIGPSHDNLPRSVGAGPPDEGEFLPDLEVVRMGLARIERLVNTDRLADAREDSADLLIDFQPLIVKRADLYGRMLDLLERCHATALRRRLLVAVHGAEAASGVHRSGVN